jgi:hypothetical protein
MSCLSHTHSQVFETTGMVELLLQLLHSPDEDIVRCAAIVFSNISCHCGKEAEELLGPMFQVQTCRSCFLVATCLSCLPGFHVPPAFLPCPPFALFAYNFSCSYLPQVMVSPGTLVNMDTKRHVSASVAALATFFDGDTRPFPMQFITTLRRFRDAACVTVRARTLFILLSLPTPD